MKKVTKYFLLWILMLAGCEKPKHLQPAQYLRFMEDEDNSYRRKIVTGDVEYVVQLATPEYMACRQFSGEPGLTATSEMKDRIKEMNGHLFFIVKWTGSSAKPSVTQTMQQNSLAEPMVRYYQQQAANDLALIDGQDTVGPVTYLFEDNVGLSPYNTIVVGFEKPVLNKDCQLIFNDRFHGNPMIKASYSKNDFNKLPGLEIK